MRKPPLLLLMLATLVAAIFAYLNNAYQERKREETRQAEAAIEKQQHEQFGQAYGEGARVPLDRNSRDRPERQAQR
jgi:type II secretory pathway pseudopilin PulG